MTHHGFFKPSGAMNAGDVLAMGGESLVNPTLSDRLIVSLSAFDSAFDGSLVFADSKEYSARLSDLPLCTLICPEALATYVPRHVAAIVARKPQQLFAKAGRSLFPETIRPTSFSGVVGIAVNATIAHSAQLESSVTVEAGAIIGEFVEIGAGSVIGPGAIVGAGCKIGRDCIIGPNATVLNSYFGNRVLVHAGARIGQDGFGFVPGEHGLEKMPHVGRVILQDDVEIGANTTIDRGSLSDTVVGEGSKIDNLVQIAHNCRIGRNCVITGHCGLSGSVTLGDRVMLGGRVGIADHVTIGDGAQVAAASGVMNNIPAGERWAGAPAQQMKDFFREVAVIRNLVREKREKRP
jgi:UDP-3-O-[3-hydroxymyristoyl] glucosamine N-acyltransferase